MNKDKQIEEMAYEMTQYKGKMCERIEHNNCLLKFHTNAFINCNYCKLAEHLITEKGYRKASEVAEEIFAEIEAEYGKQSGADRGDDLTYGEIQDFFAELKKKYAEDKQ